MEHEDHVDTLVIDHTGPSAHDIRLLGIAQLLSMSATTFSMTGAIVT